MKTNKIIPLGDRVVLKVDKADEVSEGGILIPDVARTKSQKALVVSVGDGYQLQSGTRVPLSVKEGDKVIFNSYSGVDIKIGNENLLIISEGDILATY